ncbi:MAG: ABC transporter ATP-binding protein [Desulfurococcales archaeon]|nr:ABC transporter ATP-binding protein [Desulfurococcales archaeon]MEB3779596.1 ABC transporter ATP-binding protein [Desulfurococcales archaeon]
MKPVLIVENVRKYYGRVAAVDGVSLTVPEATTIGLIGPNGAGKTTLLDVISGITRPDSGSVKLAVEGGVVEITGKPISVITMLGVARAFQIPNVFDGLSVIDNIRTAIIASKRLYKSISRNYDSLTEVDEDAKGILELVGLYEKKDVKASNLSHGERKLLDIAIALVARPRVLLLDEPTSGLSALEKGRITSIIESLKKERIPMLIVEHDLDVVFSVSDRVIAMHEGKILVEGDPESVKADQRLRYAYFGE